MRRRDTALRERRLFLEAPGGARFGRKGFDGKGLTLSLKAGLYGEIHILTGIV